jgi:hypothetical protein
VSACPLTRRPGDHVGSRVGVQVYLSWWSAVAPDRRQLRLRRLGRRNDLRPRTLASLRRSLRALRGTLDRANSAVFASFLRSCGCLGETCVSGGSLSWRIGSCRRCRRSAAATPQLAKWGPGLVAGRISKGAVQADDRLWTRSPIVVNAQEPKHDEMLRAPLRRRAVIDHYLLGGTGPRGC